MIQLGDKVRDIVTGFEGIAVAKIEYLNGCIRYEVQPETCKDGKPIDSLWIDIQQLVVTEERKINIKPVKAEGTGGPGNIPDAFSTPE